ncbi:nucleotide-diphospho-sugar transferase, partial [Rhizodiscina lignyota]
ASKSTEKLAYVTFLSSSQPDWWTGWIPFIEHDKYFTATRILAYQFLHAPTTRTRRRIPFVVMVTSDVEQRKRRRLEQDGARVVEVEDFEIDGEIFHPGSPRWKHDMTKLRINDLTDYSRLLFLDCDMIITRSMDAIFDEPSTQLRDSDASVPEKHPPSRQYIFSAVTHATRNHTFPPTEKNGGFWDPIYFNSGFLVLRPDAEMLKYYVPNLSSDRFSWRFPQQNFLNFAHRGDGAVPWQRLPTHWNIVFPNLEDYEAGVASLHDKWWSPYDKRLKEKFMAVKRDMEDYYA